MVGLRINISEEALVLTQTERGKKALDDVVGRVLNGQDGGEVNIFGTSKEESNFSRRRGYNGVGFAVRVEGSDEMFLYANVRGRVRRR